MRKLMLTCQVPTSHGTEGTRLGNLIESLAVGQPQAIAGDQAEPPSKCFKSIL